LRDTVIASRRCLKKSGISITEDLTKENAALLRRLHSAPTIKESWSWQGKIFALVENIRKPQRFDIFDDL
jgi:hypothetical protein